MDDFQAKIASYLETFDQNSVSNVLTNGSDRLEIYNKKTTTTILESPGISAQINEKEREWDLPHVISPSRQNLIGETAAKLIASHPPALLAAAAATAAGIKCTTNYLPPMGVFWDIENCQVPKGRSATAVTRVIRDRFLTGYKEVEFIVVCDVQKENKQIVQELNDAQVDLIHVSATCKNAADEKLRQSIRRFGDIHGSPAAIILISGDINFAADLSDLRHRKKIHVILLHNENTSEALVLCADEHYDFTKLLMCLPLRTPTKTADNYYLVVYNLPGDKDVTGIKRRLKQLSNNCGGRIVHVKLDKALVRFSSQELADRAQKRMHGEYVYDSRIEVKPFKQQNCSFRNLVSGSSDHQEGTASESETSDTPRQMHGSNPAGGGRNPQNPPFFPPGLRPSTAGSVPYYQGINQAFMPNYRRPQFLNNDVQSFSDQGVSPVPAHWHASGSQNRNNFNSRFGRLQGNRPMISNLRNAHQSSISVWNSSDRMNYPVSSRLPLPPAEWNAPPRQNWSIGNNGVPRRRPLSRQSRSPSPMLPRSWTNTQHLNSSKCQTPVPDRNRPSSSLSNPRDDWEGDMANQEVAHICNAGRDQPVELQISNLEHKDVRETRRDLLSLFHMNDIHNILHISVYNLQDNSVNAVVRLPNLETAQLAISKLHRKNFGSKRLLMTYNHSEGPDIQTVKSQVVTLLEEVPNHSLPLFTFREMYENRFAVSISIAELFKMKDVCVTTDDPSGRMVKLNPDHHVTPTPEPMICRMHPGSHWETKGWAEQEAAPLPNVRFSIRDLKEKVEQMLYAHQAINPPINVPLQSFPVCYMAQFEKPLEEDNEKGVPLEHLISCIPEVDIVPGLNSIKEICWAPSRDHGDNNDGNRVAPQLANELSLFSRELVDLLKTTHRCQLSFSRFIPAYHHHFGRQCRVADYGFTKLIELFEALPHTVQVMGEGNKRVVTLTHKAQVRRFTSDLLRVLKAQASKQVTLSEFPTVYNRVIGKEWNVIDYGVCEMEDILGAVSENTVVVIPINDDQDYLIKIPKKEQTPEEKEKTKAFASQVVELLRLSPQQSMLFNKFVPSYHHHYGTQCRVSEFGFMKLIELFEALPETVRIEDSENGERRICLTEKEGIPALIGQIYKLIVDQGTGRLNIDDIERVFTREYGWNLRPSIFKCGSIMELIRKLDGFLEIVFDRTGTYVTINKSKILTFGLRCRRVLMNTSRHCSLINKFKISYEQIFHEECSLDKYTCCLENFIKITPSNGDKLVELTKIQQFAVKVHQVLMKNDGKLLLSQFENAYYHHVGAHCRYAEFGHNSLYNLLKALSCTVVLKELPGHRKKKIEITLNRKLQAVGIPVLPKNSTSPDSDSSNGSLENCSVLSNSYMEQAVLQQNPKNDQQKMQESTAAFSWRNWKNLPSDQSELDSHRGSLDISPNQSFDHPNHPWGFWNTKSGSMDLGTDIQMPDMSQVPSYSSSSEQIADLLSPMKNLLPATANPLDAHSSSYYCSEDPVAPPPSALPLPTMGSLTPKSNTSLNQTASSGSKSSPTHVSSSENDNSNKRSFAVKSRLAVQFPPTSKKS